MKNFWTLFVPRPHYFVTPILINLNILVFVVLALSGMHVLSPDGQDLIAVGANFGPYTLTGEWWRLLNSMFLHIGIIHLLVNMYALANIGGVLEPLVGRKQFIVAYILCGLAGSLVSLWWDQLRISAGASGAIFGMFGMFMTMILLEREMSWQEKKGMVLNMLGVIAFNLLFGLQGGIDNAAHIGGLVLGIIFGGVLLMRSGRYIAQSYNMLGTALTTVIILVAFTGLYFQIPVANAKYLTMLEDFGIHEQRAMEVLQEMEKTASLANGGRYVSGLEEGIGFWDESIRELMELEEMPDLGEREAKEVEILLNYTRLRKKSYEMMRDDIKSNQPWMHPKQQQVLWAISTYVKELQYLREGKEGDPVADTPGSEHWQGTEYPTGQERPLFVIDGAVQENMEQAELDLHPDDIASVTVLKDSAAVRLYGERARNGVVLISTKQE
ncbi:rhomboid family intramembrane serine protease [Pontibacter sp. JH31]|uniref:Rhomboid family intramembrane serine protease n=1 Tax=Pontibacter aquaedesilientis TaxID=2766980 RepID=A0ABR7XGP7_9BACT|nr:rhomboid family intramembrane serine protease [Pontibacter aquaedesilientis]